MRRGDPACTANFEAAGGLKVIGPDRRELPRGEVGLLAGPTNGKIDYAAVQAVLAGPLRAGQRPGC